MNEDNIVVVKDLEKKYKSGTHAVKGINFDVKKGEIFGMLGPNGAGKTTTLQMMGTLLNITSGEIKIIGYDVASDSNQVRENIGFAKIKFSFKGQDRRKKDPMSQPLGFRGNDSRPHSNLLSTRFGNN